MKKLTLIISICILSICSYSQSGDKVINEFLSEVGIAEYPYEKYPNIDSLKPILLEALKNYTNNKTYSFLNSSIITKDSLMYSHYNHTSGYHMYLDTLASEEYIKTVLDPNLSNFISHPDYKFKILENGIDGFYNAQSKWVIILMIHSEKFDDQLVVEFNFHFNNKLQYINIIGS